MDNKQAAEFVSKMWDDEIIPEISEYIKVPNKSPHFDPDWEKHGYMDDAVAMLEAWCREHLTPEVVRCRLRRLGLVIELDSGTHAQLTGPRRLDVMHDLRSQVGGLADVNIALADYQRGSAFVGDRNFIS